MKAFTVPEMSIDGHSRSSAMSSVIRSPGHSIRDRKNRLHLFSDKIAEMTLNVNQGHCDGTIQQDTYHFTSINRTIGQFRKWMLQLLQRMVNILNNIFINVLGTVLQICYRNFQYMCVDIINCRQRNEMVDFLCATLY